MEDRLPPGQVLTERFPVLHYGRVPEFDPETWCLMIWGEVEAPLRLSWQDIQSLPKRQMLADLHCVTRWSKLDTLWEGFGLDTLGEAGLLRLTGKARFLIQHAAHGFTSNLPIEAVRAENFLFATGYEGNPLSPEHGAPLRGVCGAIPGRRDLQDLYLWKGAKWLIGLEFCEQDRPGFWERAGYHNRGEVWKEERSQGVF